MALAWGVAWSGLGLVLSSIAFLLIRGRVPSLPVSFFVRGALNWTLLGVIAGAVFAIVLSAAESRVRSVYELSVRRTALWGALAGLAVPLAYPNFWVAYNAGFLQTLILMPLCGVLVAASAAGSLAIAQRSSAPLADPGGPQPAIDGRSS